MFCAYTTDTGRALIDREVYLPAAWCEDADRCQVQRIPRPRAKAVVTEPELGRRMVERCRRAKVPFGWVAADSAYGQDRKLRSALERRRIPYVMAVPVDETVHTHGTGNPRVDAFAATVPLLFERRSCGAGAKGLRSYDWALAEVTWPGGAEGGPHPDRLLRRPRQGRHPDRRDRARDELRWSIEDCFETAKSDCGLDHYEVRTGDAWHRHITLSMAALTFLTITDTRTRDLPEPDSTAELPTPADPARTPEKGEHRGLLKS